MLRVFMDQTGKLFFSRVAPVGQFSLRIKPMNLGVCVELLPAQDRMDTSGPCEKFCNAQSPAVGPRQGARRREWQALSKGCNTALAQQRGSLRAGARVPSPALRSLELALASPTLR